MDEFYFSPVPCEIDINRNNVSDDSQVLNVILVTILIFNQNIIQ